MAKVKIKALTSCSGNFQKDGSMGLRTSLAMGVIYEVDNTTFKVDELIESGCIELVKKPVKTPVKAPVKAPLVEEVLEEDKEEKQTKKKGRAKASE